MLFKPLAKKLCVIFAALSLSACGNVDLTNSLQDLVKSINIPGLSFNIQTTTLSKTPMNGMVGEGSAVTITLSSSAHGVNANIPFTITGDNITVDDISSMSINGAVVTTALTGTFITTGDGVNKVSVLVINFKSDNKTEGKETLIVTLDEAPTVTTSVDIEDKSINVVAAAAPTAPLIQQSNLVYVGAFRYPNLPYTGNVCDGWSYGGQALTFNPNGNGGAGSLLATGHVYCGRVGEFTIPEATNTISLGNLRYAQMVGNQPTKLIDSLEGKLYTSGITGGTGNTINGLFVYNNNLIVSAGNSYTYTQPVSHFTRPLDLNVTGQVSDARRVVGNGYDNPRFTSGYMCSIPPEFRDKFGGPVATGWVADSIVSAASNGPALFAFDPEKLKTETNITARTLLAYPVSNPLEESVTGQAQLTWNWTSIPRNCAIPNGTDSALFIGRHGTGMFAYGAGGTSGGIYDPADNSTGEHAWPYIYQVWAYRASDLAKVAAGEVPSYSIKPYAVWKLTLPFSNDAANNELGGMAYDPKTRRLYISQSMAGPYGEPVIHVFTVNNAVAP